MKFSNTYFDVASQQKSQAATVEEISDEEEPTASVKKKKKKPKKKKKLSATVAQFEETLRETVTSVPPPILLQHPSLLPLLLRHPSPLILLPPRQPGRRRQLPSDLLPRLRQSGQSLLPYTGHPHLFRFRLNRQPSQLVLISKPRDWMQIEQRLRPGQTTLHYSMYQRRRSQYSIDSQRRKRKNLMLTRLASEAF